MTEKNPIKVAMGKKSRAAGAAFELRTRKDLIENGWIVDKWSNNVEFETRDAGKLDIDIGEDYSCTLGIKSGKIISAKRKYAGPGRPMAIGTGFPDFVAFRNISYDNGLGEKNSSLYEAIGVECKTNGYLDKVEKEKCKWYLDNAIFGKIFIASKTKVKNKIVIKYEDFEDKYGK